MCSTASVRSSQTRMPAPTPATASSSAAISWAVIRKVSSSRLSSAVTSTVAPAVSTSRERASTSLNAVTSHEPAASEMRTHAMRLPVRVMRSFEPITQPASFRETPRADNASS